MSRGTGRDGRRGQRRGRRAVRVTVEAGEIPSLDALGLFVAGDSYGTRKALEAIVKKARETGDVEGEIAALMNLATSEGARADHRRARVWAEQAIQKLGKGGDTGLLAMAWFQGAAPA